MELLNKTQKTDQSMIDKMTLQLKKHAGAIFAEHQSSQNKAPAKEIVKALIKVAAAMAITFGYSKEFFIKIAFETFDEINKKKTISLSSVVGGESGQNKTLN